MSEYRMTPAMTRALIHAQENGHVRVVSLVGNADPELQEEGVFERPTIHKLVHLKYLQQTPAFNQYAITPEGVERLKDKPKRKKNAK